MNVGLFFDEIINKDLNNLLSNNFNVFCFSIKDIDDINFVNNNIYIPKNIINYLLSYNSINDIHKGYIEIIKELQLDLIIIEDTNKTNLFANITANILDIPIIRYFNDVSLESIHKYTSNNCVKFITCNDIVYSKLIKFGFNDYDLVNLKLSNIKNIVEMSINEYKYSYTIKKIRVKNDDIVLSLESFNNENLKLLISLDSYNKNFFKIETKLSKLTYNYLKRNEIKILAYRGVIKKLSIKDHSEKEIVDTLRNKYKLDDDDINEIVVKLKTYNLIDDLSFTKSRIEFLKQNKNSSKSIINKLKKSGINKEIIQECLNTNNDEELDFAKSKANKYFNTIKNKSLNAIKQSIYTKLINDGFTYDIAKEAINSLDFTENINNELYILKKELNKALNKYKNKYTDYELKNRIYKHLVSKGFNFEDINEIINEMENEYER